MLGTAQIPQSYAQYCGPLSCAQIADDTQELEIAHLDVELPTLNWKLRTGGNFRILRRLLAYQDNYSERGGYTIRGTYSSGLATFDAIVCTQLLGLRESEPRSSANEIIDVSKTYLRKHAAKVYSCPASPPLPFNSKLTSNIGSVVVVILLHRSHLTSLCSKPSKVEWTMQMQESLVDPREVA